MANPEKSRANGRRWASENPEAALNARLLRDYGISLAEYRALELKQGGVCAICLQPEVNKSRLVVDHDHETGRVRGLLCSNCNVALGMFRDDMRVIESALSYLENGDCYGPLVTY